jgi:hypothetical protein
MKGLDRIACLVESDTYCNQLREVRSMTLPVSEHVSICHFDLTQLSLSLGVPEDKVVRALQLDEVEISNLLITVLNSEANERAVMELNPEDTEKFMNLLQIVSVQNSECR